MGGLKAADVGLERTSRTMRGRMLREGQIDEIGRACPGRGRWVYSSRFPRVDYTRLLSVSKGTVLREGGHP